MTAAQDWLDVAFSAAEKGTAADGIRCLLLGPHELLDAAQRLRDALGYGRFIDLTAVDDPDEEERFELQYLLYSMDEHLWLRLKVRTEESVPSLTPLFAGANWFERELYDLFGVRFEGHPSLTRILMPDDWEGYPLRKDSPIGGEPVDFTVTREIYGTATPLGPGEGRSR